MATAIIMIRQTAMAQTEGLKISGTIDSTVRQFFNTHELLVKLYDPAKKLLNEEEIIKVPISKDRTFKLDIKLAANLQYLSFLVQYNGDKDALKGETLSIFYPGRPGNLINEEVYLFERGDDILINIFKNGKISFRGNGAEKLKCQYKLYSAVPFMQNIGTRSSELGNLKKYQEQIELEDVGMNLSISLLKKIVESYRGQLGDTVYNLLYLDAIARQEYTKVYSSFDMTNEKQTAALKNHYKDYLVKSYTNGIDAGYFSLSADYPELLFQKELNTYKLSDKNQFGPGTFKAFFEIIRQKYKGALRDRLLLIAVLKSNPDQVKDIIDQVIATAGDLNTKKALDIWKSRNSLAFPFELQDTRGSMHTLKDYRGKLIVIDFWFTYCGGCKILNAAMHPIIEKYKTRKDIVFLTVNCDKDKQQWLKSRASGAYTSPGTIDLYTNGLGFEHPLMKNYNYTSAPRQLIIDKNGKLITAAPPSPTPRAHLMQYRKQGDVTVPFFDPDTVLASPNAKAFIEILDRNLLK